MSRKKTSNAYNDEKPIGKVPKKSSPKSTVQTAISGEFFVNSKLSKWYPTLLYCILLTFIYIGHNFNFRRLQRLEIRQRIELDNERSRAMVYSSMKMNASRHSRIYEEISRRNINLKESSVPPKSLK